MSTTLPQGPAGERISAETTAPGAKYRREHWQAPAGDMSMGDAAAMARKIDDIEKRRCDDDGVYCMLFGDDANDTVLNRRLRDALTLLMRAPEWPLMDPAAKLRLRRSYEMPHALSRRQKIVLLFCMAALFHGVKTLLEQMVHERGRSQFSFFMDQIVLPAFARLVKGQEAFDFAGATESAITAAGYEAVAAAAAAAAAGAPGLPAGMASSSSSVGQVPPFAASADATFAWSEPVPRPSKRSRTTVEREICFASTVPSAPARGSIDANCYRRYARTTQYVPMMDVDIFATLISTRYIPYCGVTPSRYEPPVVAERIAENARTVLH